MQVSRLFTILLVSLLFSASANSLQAQKITHVPLYTFDAERVFDFFGTSVSGAGDVNGDGFADLIVGAPNFEFGFPTGIAHVLSGIDGSLLYRFEGGRLSGTSVSAAGDVNGDGTPDLIVGAPGLDFSRGTARVLSGSDGSVLYNLSGARSHDRAGYSVGGAGDVNGDGIDDFIVGAPFFSNDGNFTNNLFSGSARVISGIDGSVLYNFDGDSANDRLGDRFGWSVSGAGDVNGDGFADVIVGAPRDDNNGISSGSVRVLSGSDGSVLYNLNGDSTGDAFGYSVSGAGDVNGDGVPDLIVGAPFDDNSGSASGTARVFSGSDGSVLFTFNGEDAGDYFGYSVSGAGDVNGDGTPDLIVGAPSNLFSSDSGSARVLSGSDGSVLYTFNADSAGDDFGWSVSGAGDVNGDGIDDFIVGAPGDGHGTATVFVSQISEPVLLGDVNQDGVVNFGDIFPFVLNLLFGDYLAEADTNEDGVVSFSDIPSFITILLSS